jgi:adenine deaminase
MVSVSRYELARVALGQAEADLAVINAKIVNVYTAELLEGDTVLIKGDKIAYVGPNAKGSIGPQTRIIDAAGKTVIPGLIDGHTHTDYIYSSHELVRFAMKTGTTTIITDVVELTFALGYQGFTEFLRSVRNQPVKFRLSIPPMVTISPVMRRHLFTRAQLDRLLREKDVMGLGEMYWGPVIAGDPHQLEIIDQTLDAGKKIEGHGAGATGNKLQAYAALGITSDHEPITAAEALERMRLGLSVMIREGEIRKDLAAVSLIKDQKLDFRRLAVSTDGIGPKALITKGFMDHLLQETIDLGFPPIQAVQMATLNVAEHFNLQDFIGGIAPGRFADIVMIPNLTNIKPELVISNGQVVAENGELKVQPRRHVYSVTTHNSIHLDREFAAEDFRVRADSQSPTLKVRVIDQITNLLTKEAVLELPVRGGEIKMDLQNNVIKVTAIERHYAPGQTFTGFIRGFGLKAGAIATSTSWDSSDLVVVGAGEADMALAVNRLHQLNGGMVVCRDGKILAEIAFPVGGMISTETMEIIAEKLDRIQDEGTKLGCTSPGIRTTVSVLTTGAIPYLRICESGLFNLRLNRMVDLVVSEQ